MASDLLYPSGISRVLQYEPTWQFFIDWFVFHYWVLPKDSLKRHIFERNTKQILVLMKNINNTWNPSLQTQAMLVNSGVWECMLFREWRFISFQNVFFYLYLTEVTPVCYLLSILPLFPWILWYKLDVCTTGRNIVHNINKLYLNLRGKIELSFTSSLTELGNVKVHEKIKRNLTSLWNQ